MKKLGVCFVVLVTIFFNLHLVSSITQKVLAEEQNGVKDIVPVMEKLSSRVVIRRGGGRSSPSRGSGGGSSGHGGGTGGGSGHGGGGSSGKGGRRGTYVPIMGGAVGAGNHQPNHRSGSQSTGRPTALVMLHAWILLCVIHFVLPM